MHAERGLVRGVWRNVGREVGRQEEAYDVDTRLSATQGRQPLHVLEDRCGWTCE
jgi:hypothetical protein